MDDTIKRVAERESIRQCAGTIVCHIPNRLSGEERSKLESFLRNNFPRSEAFVSDGEHVLFEITTLTGRTLRIKFPDVMLSA